MRRLEDKLCIVTGAARGIGHAIAARFRDEGARVVMTDVDEAAGIPAAEALGAEFLLLDVREEDALGRARRGSTPACDVLVNNAGVTGFEGGAVPHDPETRQPRRMARGPPQSTSTAPFSAAATRSAR